ncbi:RNA polymerase sigma factor [Achromobacter aloeverae]|uniref:RNA polymerase sigma factor n=1 Tax=Achromobacter aloeverae TaxID=1750518 RepID=A0A4Q1HQF9_9BURK|nr:sigma-70 family RNA polymerase sigma factor [Achromobacter aloeverae]RXN93308.1 RNA polymerase sigma factor [Achromobacter aloeverae]
MTAPSPLHPLAEDAALRRRLIALARRWLPQADEAEDLVHDVYLRTAAGGLPATASGREAWLVTVLRHLCIDYRRRQERYLAILAQAGDDAVHTLQDDQPPQQADQAERVDAALAHLSRTLAPGDAAALLLYEMFEFSHAELAALAGRSEEASRQHLHRLLRRLRAAPPLHRRRDPDAAAADPDEDAVYLYALCRQALAQRDPGGLIAVLRASTPQAMAALANALPAARADAGEPTPGLSRVTPPWMPCVPA